MANKGPSTFTCSICKQSKGWKRAIQGDMVHGGVLEEIQEKHPGWSPDGLLCQDCLRLFRAEYVEDVLKRQIGEITTLEAEVVRSLRENELLSEDTNAEFEQGLTFGQRVADRVASFGGSWPFILSFAFFLLVWIVINTIALQRQPFDPYPYILLNLVLSCLAAIQAPVIMMSQNRQETRDRLRAQNDYRVNLKAELEIRHLHTKLDELLTRQWQRLLEIQRIQTEMLQDLAQRK